MQKDKLEIKNTTSKNAKTQAIDLECCFQEQDHNALLQIRHWNCNAKNETIM